MPKKALREMTKFQRFRHSLGIKTFRAVLLFAFIIGIAAIVFSFLLYSASVQREFKSIAWNISKTATVVIDKDKASDYSNAILRRFETIPEEQIGTMSNEELEEYFADVMDAGFMKLRATLHNIQVENEALSVYLVALDTENSRIIYLIDSDYTDKFLPPGFTEDLPPDEVETYLGNRKPGRIETYLGGSMAIPSYISDTPEYGYICTSCDPLFGGIRNYPIFAFTDVDMTTVVKMSRDFLWQFIILLLAVAVILCFLMMFYLRKKVVHPINALAGAAESYIMAKKSTAPDKQFFANLDIRTGDEIENLSSIMKDMETDIAEYERNLTKATAEKERISTELSVGKQIQESMVPHIFPPFPERTEFELYATMTPAKEIGGDFYDFFLIDDDHLALVMADVSGKGIPAALFMMYSKIMLKNTASFGQHSPAKTLELVNNEICRSNQADMFVTVWIGILEISTGKMVCANAGHEYPVIRKEDGRFELFRDRHGFVVGGMDGMKYQDYELQFAPGDMLFVYTDGVTEATDAEKQLFGTDRMIDALNQAPVHCSEAVISHMHEEIRAFVGDADQFDDITMLCFLYKGKGGADE